MEEVSKWLGHSSIFVTERHYAFLTVDNLHEAVGTAESELPEAHQMTQSGRVFDPVTLQVLDFIGTASPARTGDL